MSTYNPRFQWRYVKQRAFVRAKGVLIALGFVGALVAGVATAFEQAKDLAMNSQLERIDQFSSLWPKEMVSEIRDVVLHTQASPTRTATTYVSDIYLIRFGSIHWLTEAEIEQFAAMVLSKRKMSVHQALRWMEQVDARLTRDVVGFDPSVLNVSGSN